jgi:hypothetical protein
MNELREFSKSDWDGFAGAACLPDDTQPRIREIELSNADEPDCPGGAIIIVSGYEDHPGCITGCVIEVYLYIYGTAYGDTPWSMECSSQRLALLIANGLQVSDCSPEALEAIGFKPIII